MSDFTAFVHLGFRHIVALDAMDHILFLFALAAIYRPRDWRDALAVITAFTVGHSVTLALAVTQLVTFPTAVIEFCIPLTIVATGIENLFRREHRPLAPWRRYTRPALAGVFGLIHGAGFANYLRSLFLDRIALPLFGFNVGIELGQIVVLLLIGAVLAAMDRALTSLSLPRSAPSPLRLRIVMVSSIVAVVAAHWALERSPW